MSTEEIIQKIAAAKKYKALYPKTIARVVLDCARKHPAQLVEQKARNILHQIWGIFYPTRPNFQKMLEHFAIEIKRGQDVKTAVLPLLRLHASTKERISCLDQFYERIFAVTGKPETILDLASGLNPLTYFWLPEGVTYFAYDIDQEQAHFLQKIFKLLKVNRVKIGLGDVFSDRFPKTDVVFLLKILPLIYQQQKTKSLEILEKQEAEHLVVSFPTKTVSGKEKGMAEFYAKQFEELVKEKPWLVTKILFPTELIFIIKK